MNHDRLFKELLTTFFFEFLELFFPTLAALVDRSQEPEFLDKETYTESTREMDLVVRLRLLEGEAFFIVHAEHEAQDISVARHFCCASRPISQSQVLSGFDWVARNVAVARDDYLVREKCNASHRTFRFALDARTGFRV